MSFSYRGETKELNEVTRKEASGSFVELSGGITHYELSNPEVEETIILVHGFSVPFFIYDSTFEFLTRSGFRVLRYDLFGRGYSDRPISRYDIDLFVRQLGDLVDALRFAHPFSLVGLSLGGPVAATYSVQHPERVKKLVLIDPAGAQAIDNSLTVRVAKTPVVGELLFGQIGSSRMINSVASNFFDPVLVEHFQSRYRVQMQYKGFMRAILSTMRNGMLGQFRDVYQRLGKMHQPVLLFWGRDDNTIPFRHSDDLRALIPAIEFHAIENCGHTPHYEKPDEVNPILLKFLKE